MRFEWHMRGKFSAELSGLDGVVVSSGGSVPSRLGVVRAFGRRGIPVACLVSGPISAVGYSKYVTLLLRCASVRESEVGFVRALLDFGRCNGGRMMIIPTGDRDVLALAKHKRDLEEFYYLPVCAFETVQTLVNKKSFYRMLAKKRVPHPRTCFPESLDELRSMAPEFAYPFIIKPAYSVLFQEEFGRKCFLVRDADELDWALGRLRGRNLDVVMQEIIPGDEIYAFYTYLNRESEPLAVCGYDKVRHFPPDFGFGSYCTSKMRPEPTERCIRLLQSMGYQGFAEPELKRDPRDGQYKLLEINARTTLQNRLAAASGVAIEYVAYQDAAGRFEKGSVSFNEGIHWTDDFRDLLSCLLLLRDKRVSLQEVVRSLTARKEHSVAASDDIAPSAFYVAHLVLRGLVRSRGLPRSTRGLLASS